jgi:xanthine dehydrogenase accessory factor
VADFIESVINAIESGQGATLATLVGPRGLPHGLLGRKLVVASDGRVEGTLGSAALDGRVVSASLDDTDAAHGSRLATIKLAEEGLDLGLRPGDEVQIFLDRVMPAPTLLIVGAGHIAQPLCSIAKTLGFDVAVMDDRVSFANRERFPDADRIVVGYFTQELAHFPIHRSTYIIIVTRGHAYDEDSLRSVIGSDAAYIGMIGSTRKVRTVLENLAAAGIPREQLDRVYSPIGLDIAAETPAEIAVSILAEIVNVRRRGQRSPSSMSATRRN